MGRVMRRRYLDTIERHPELSDEELDNLIKKADEESKKLKEWPKM